MLEEDGLVATYMHTGLIGFFILVVGILAVPVFIAMFPFWVVGKIVISVGDWYIKRSEREKKEPDAKPRDPVEFNS
jgi:hypothetical protein